MSDTTILFGWGMLAGVVLVAVVWLALTAVRLRALRARNSCPTVCSAHWAEEVQSEIVSVLTATSVEGRG